MPLSDPMALAISLALRAQGRTAPNPCVGAVLIDARSREVVASGHHTGAGLAHAEVEAIRRIPAGINPADLILYVTLEPCCVFGKTPPCTQAILDAGITQVVVGTLDPDPRMQGRGVELLKDAGVQVTSSSEHHMACKAVIRSFAKRVLTGKPWVVAKWAMTLDGKIATHTGKSRWITSQGARAHAHLLRDQCDAILVGTTTLLRDDPSLTCRLDGGGGRDPVRVVLDARLVAPLESKVFHLDSSAPTWVVVGEQAPASGRQALESLGVRVMQVGVDERGWLKMDEVLEGLGTLGVNSVLVEGGSGVLGSLHELGQIDEVVGFVAPKIFGGVTAPSAVAGGGVGEPGEALTMEEVEWVLLGGGEAMCRGVVHREAGAGYLWER